MTLMRNSPALMNSAISYTNKHVQRPTIKFRWLKKADRIIHHLRQLEVQQGGNVKENELIDAQGQLNALHRDNPRLQHNSVLQRAKQKHDLHKGDAVLVKSYGQYGELLSKRGNHKWEVQIGILKMEIDENNLEKVAKKDLPREKMQSGDHGLL